MDSLCFYQNLPPCRQPLALLFQKDYFHDIPADWQVIVTDIKNSTLAVMEGRYNDVNLVAAASLIAALNIAKKSGLEVPFFFGGDGSTLLVPSPLLKEVMTALAAHSRNCQTNFDLELRTGSVPVSTILDKGHGLCLARLQIAEGFHKAVALGSGLRFAEQVIKQEQQETDTLPITGTPDLEGLECRWNKVAPRAEEAVNVCYLVEAVHAEKQMEVYASLFQMIDSIYGDLPMRHPLSIERLKPALQWTKMKKEMLVKFGKWKPAYLADSFLRTFFGRFAFRYNWTFGSFNGRRYLQQLIAHSDTLAIDGRITTIICAVPDKHKRFLDYLQEAENEGLLIFGHYASKESILTCYIENRNDGHIHFVDGANGGYTEASKEFKTKIRRLSPVIP